MGKDKLIILENGTIYDPYKNKKKSGSILIVNGVLKEVGEVTASDNMRKINCSGKLIVPGLIDIHAHFREPGREDKETLVTGARAAFSGGFTRVCVCLLYTSPSPRDYGESGNPGGGLKKK